MKYKNFTNIRQNNNCLLDHIGHMFRPVKRSPSGLKQNKSKVLLKIGIPIFCTVVDKCELHLHFNSTFDLFCCRPDDDLLTGRNM